MYMDDISSRSDVVDDIDPVKRPLSMDTFLLIRGCLAMS